MVLPRDTAGAYAKRELGAHLGFSRSTLQVAQGALFFDGVTNGVTSGNPPSVVPAGSCLSIGAWVKCSLASSATTQTLVANVAVIEPTGFADWLILYRRNSNVLASVLFGQFGVSDLKTQASGAIIAGAWQFVCATWDRDTLALKLYIDGQLYADAPQVGVGGTSGAVEIGARNDVSGLLQRFDGCMGPVCVWQSCLTPEQIRVFMWSSTFETAQALGLVNRFYSFAADLLDATDEHNASAIGSLLFVPTRPHIPNGVDLLKGTAFARCLSGRALSFDGSTDRLSAESFSNNASSSTLCLWFNTSNKAATQWLFSNASVADARLQVFLTNGDLHVNDTVNSVVIPAARVRQDFWHFVCAVVNSSGVVSKAWLDGVEYPTTTPYVSANTATGLVIGARNESASGPFAGMLASFKVFDVPLTHAQVLDLYRAPELVLPVGVLPTSLRRHYAFADYSDTGGTGGRYFSDAGMDSRNALDLGSASMALSQGEPCPQFALTDSASRLYFPANNALAVNFALAGSLGADFTFAAWVLPFNNTSQSKYALLSVGNSDQFSVCFLASGQLEIKNAQTATTVEAIVPGEWVHVAIVGSSVAPFVKVYLDGELATVAGAIDPSGITSAAFKVGSLSASSASPARCIVAESAVWGVNLGQGEVLQLYASGVIGEGSPNSIGAPPLAWHKYDGLTSLRDYSGNGLTATVTPGFVLASFVENRNRSSVVGTFSMKRYGADVLNLGAISTIAGAITTKDQGFYPDPMSGGSFSCFFRLQKPGVGATLFANAGMMQSAGAGWRVNMNSAGRLTLVLGDGASPGVSASVQSVSGITDSEWHHFAFTVDYGAATTINLYVDGLLDVTSSAVFLAGVPVPTPLYLGGNSAAGDFTNNGAIACLRFYKTRLSQSEISRIYYSDKRIFGGLANV